MTRERAHFRAGFRRQGEAVTEGLSLGIEDGTNNVVNAAKKALQSTIKSFSGIKGQFTSIGSNAMLGLNAGLNAGRNRVMATARSIANSVASTMKAALEIRSPSRLMRDEIGKMIPAGIIEGIEGNVDSLYQVLQKMTNKMVEVSSPEVALGTNMGYAGNAFGSQVYNTYNTSTVNGGVYEFNIEIPLDGEVVAQKTVRFTARELEKMKVDKARGKGIRTI